MGARSDAFSAADAGRPSGRLALGWRAGQRPPDPVRSSDRGDAARLPGTPRGGHRLREIGNRLIVTDPLGDKYDPDVVVIAGGAWTPKLGDQIGISLPIEPQRGQILHLGWGDDSPEEWPLLESASSHYMLGFPEKHVVAGATREFGVGYDARITPRGLHGVLTEALAIAPGVGRCQILEMRVGCGH